MKTIYLDACATTPVFPEAVKAMLPYFTKEYGNPSSPHRMGEDARKAVESARREIALELGCKIHEILFTSGGTESNMLAFFGLARSLNYEKKKKIVVSAIEHSSVMDVCESLEKEGYEIVEVSVDRDGIVRWEELEKEVNYETLLVSVIHGNHEIGTLQDISRIGALCKKRGVFFHTDAVQSFGKEIIKVHDWHVDMLSASAHKLGGPKGSGFLYVRPDIMLAPIVLGAQERRLRGGTENVAGIVGFAKALEILRKKRMKLNELQKVLMQGIEKLGGTITGSKEHRLQDHVSATFPDVDAEMLVLLLSQNGVMCSTKSACLTRGGRESKVLRAIGLSSEEIQGAVRFGLSSLVTKKKLTNALDIIGKCLKKVQRRN